MESLFGDFVKWELYYDVENDELFFDRNWIMFESVFYFYVISGMLVFFIKIFC